MWPGGLGLLQELHPGFCWSTSRLAMIAWNAGANDVLPNVGPTSVPRYHVVQSEGFGLPAAVLAGGPIPVEHFPPGQLPLNQWPLNHVQQANDGGQYNRVADTANLSTAVLQRLRLALGQQHNGTTAVANVQRLVVLVQHKNR